MAEVGGVSYKLEADTQNAISGMKKVQAENAKAAKSFDTLDNKVIDFNDAQKKLNTNVNKTTKGMQAQKGALSNLSFQLQDVAVQAQMGTDAFIILGQQAPQALGSFGPGGAVLGAIVAVGAALLGVASNALTSAGAMDEFIKKLQELEGEELADLGASSQAVALENFQAAAAATATEISRLKREEAALLAEQEALNEKIANAGTKSISGYGSASVILEGQLKDVKAQLVGNSIAQEELTKKREAELEKVKILTGETNVYQEAIDDGISSVEGMAGAIGKSSVELAIYTKEQGLARLATQGATEAELARAAAAYDSVIAFARQTEQEQKATQATKDKAKADRDAAAAERERNAAIQTATGASPALAIGFENQSSQQELQAVYDAGIISEQEFLAQKLALNQQYEMEMAALSEERFRRESESNAFLLDSLDALGSAGTNAMSGLLSGTMDATEAVQSLANTILNQAIGALVQMGIEQVKNQLIGQSGAAAAAATSAATGTAIAAAYATPAALVSLASFGANAAPAAAALTSTTALASGLAIGGRESGGAMTGGGLYNIGEQNKPEVYQTGRGMLMQVPGDGGRMFNQNQLDQIGGGNGAFNITVVNEPGVVSVVVPQGEKDAIIRTAIDKSVAQSQANYAQSMNDKQGPYFKASAQNWGQGKASGRNT